MRMNRRFVMSGRPGILPVVDDGLPACRFVRRQARRAVFHHRQDACFPIRIRPPHRPARSVRCGLRRDYRHRAGILGLPHRARRCGRDGSRVGVVFPPRHTRSEPDGPVSLSARFVAKAFSPQSDSGRPHSRLSLARLGGAVRGGGSGPVPASPMAAWVRIAPAMAAARCWR